MQRLLRRLSVVCGGVLGLTGASALAWQGDGFPDLGHAPAVVGSLPDTTFVGLAPSPTGIGPRLDGIPLGHAPGLGLGGLDGNDLPVYRPTPSLLGSGAIDYQAGHLLAQGRGGRGGGG
ncbi:MAG: hypothetical protein ACKOJF_17465, partial [Planctomycetaceae bacterium]